MDIEILLALQNFRNGCGHFLNGFFLKFTELGGAVPMLVAVAGIFWCINKSTGLWLLFGMNVNLLVNSLLKMTFCVYRPWIRDSRIVPDSEAMKGATGYSFPSGHCTDAATLYGGLGLDRKLSALWRSFFFFVMVLIGFTRLYFCVHTPQDVLVGLTLGLIVMVLCRKIMEKCENKSGCDLVVAGIFIVLDVLAMIYILKKNYPVDYDSEGKILVDGMKMASDGIKTIGANIAFFIGWIIEKRYIKFSSEGSVVEKIIRFAVGMIGFAVVKVFILGFLEKFITGRLFMFVSYFVMISYIVFLYPLCIACFQKHRKK